MTKIKVSIQGEISGWLQQNKAKHYSFAYHPDTPSGNCVSLTMPIDEQVGTLEHLHPIFAQNLPEGYLGDVINKTVSKLYGSGDLNVLAALGPHQIGRIEYSAPDIKSVADQQDGYSIEHILQSKDNELFLELVERYSLKSGISGVQPKVLLPAHKPQNRSTIKTQGLIVKSWGDDFPELAANEYFCMSIARDAGLRVPRFDLSNNGKLFVMERFDVKPDGTYRGFEDGCVLLGKQPKEKYDSSYEKLASQLGIFSGDNAQATRKEFFTSMVVSWAVQNGDAHLKNFGVLYDDPTGEVSLSPAYDIVSTTAYLSNDIPALTLAGKKLWWKTKHLTDFGTKRCELSNQEVREIMNNVGIAVEKQSKILASYLDTYPRFADIGKPMMETLSSSIALLHDGIST